MDTQKYIVETKGANLIILEKDKIKVHCLDYKSEWTIGRYDPNLVNEPDIILESSIVSRVHGWIRNIDNQWFFIDNPKNLNGTFYNGKKLSRPLLGLKTPVMLTNNDILKIDSPKLTHLQGVFMVFTSIPVKGTWTTYTLKKDKTIIGRDPKCDIVEPIPHISSKHAEISYIGGNYYLSDCNSLSGTFLNGKAITTSVLLKEKDYITLCDCNFIFLGNKLLFTKRDRKEEQEILKGTEIDKRPIILKADIKTKSVKNSKDKGKKELIRNVNLKIRQGSLVAILGPAGSGKTTLMNCLNGFDIEGIEGTITYDNIDVIKHFDQVRYRLGIVPQDKTFRPELTPKQEFEFSAKMRLPELTKAELNKRVDQTLKILGIYNIKDRRISDLSGGEQTRVNIGIELVADRELLFLDEPDQGLDPMNKQKVFQIMQDLAHKNGKTIISIIHDVSSIDLFDQVIMLTKSNEVGQLAFSGSPKEMREYFKVDDIKDVYNILEKRH